MNVARRAAAGLACFLVAWSVSFGCTDDPLPDVAADHDNPTDGDPGLVYAVEVQARPDYRLVAYDPPSATTTALFVIPEFGALASFAADRDGERLVLSYTKDYRETGTGLYVLPLGPSGSGAETITDDDELQEIVVRKTDVAYDDVQVDDETGTIWATRTEPERSSVVEIDIETGTVVETIDGAVDPAVGDRWVAYLLVEPDESRRSIAVLDLASGDTTTYLVLEGQFDLGHLVADPDRGRVLLTALYPPDEPAIQIGSPAAAHGAHDGPSQWLTLDVATGEVYQLLEHEPMAVRDATVLGNGRLAASGIDGVVVVDEPVEVLIESRYITELAS